jgi:hypothetical protein
VVSQYSLTIKLLPAEAGRFDGGLEDRRYFDLEKKPACVNWLKFKD